jgi:hypothetical protein
VVEQIRHYARMTHSLHLTCERLVEAIRAHALVVDDGGDDPKKVMPTINEVRASALAYVEAVAEVSGWGNVFADLYDEPAAH